MIDIATRKDKTLAVIGLGASGLAAARALQASGAQVLAWDDCSEQREAAERSGIPVTHTSNMAFDTLQAIILSPGIPLHHDRHPIVDRAKAARCPIIGDIELLVEACPQARFVGITGTNGKSTTTTLLVHILETAGISAQIGGNLGPPALNFEPPEPDDVIILELSSYQLDLIDRAAFDIAVLLNISPDHLDRHGNMDSYIAAKKRIFRRQSKEQRDQVAIIGVEDDASCAVRNEIAGLAGWSVISIANQQSPPPSIYVEQGIIFDATNGTVQTVCDITEICTLQGTHNSQNAAAAYAVARSLGLKISEFAEALPTYPGLPHRMELVATIKDVTYINDSKATNVEAAAKALGSYNAIYWIAGGLAKEDHLDSLKPWLSNVRHAFLIGEAEDVFATAIENAVPYTRSGDLAAAVNYAHKMAQMNEDASVVLLSPACASFDQWKNFEARGDAFRTLVLEHAKGLNA